MRQDGTTLTMIFTLDALDDEFAHYVGSSIGSRISVDRESYNKQGHPVHLVVKLPYNYEYGNVDV